MEIVDSVTGELVVAACGEGNFLFDLQCPVSFMHIKALVSKFFYLNLDR